ncbi:MAG: 3-deoxy-7-phosphoheptulonate synthase [Thermoguttaceae bacterium]
MKTLILDNYDSFTYNLYQYLGELGGRPSVYRNDRISMEDVRDQQFTHIVIGPGPGSPYVARDIGISHELISYAETAGIPLLGVCLGHQTMAVHFGGRVARAPHLYHGKASKVVVLEPPTALFEGLASPLEVMRYHSLRVEEAGLPKVLRVTARSIEDGSVMAMEHTDRPLWGIQFHPESIGTPEGKQILRRFLDLPHKDPAAEQGLVLGQSAAPFAASALLGARHSRDERTMVRIGPDCLLGKEGTVTVIAGPCSIESESQLDKAAAIVQSQGLHVLRGGAFKPRTGPYCFQGLGLEGLRLLQKIAGRYGLATISEAMSPEQVDLVEEYCDVIQIGARNMQNYDLLRRAGKASKPVLLKRGLAATLDELLLAAEHVLSAGNSQVILCERGIRTFEKETRFTLSLGSIPPLREKTHLPIVVDPSHAAGKSRWVRAYCRAAAAIGCDGLMIEVHPNPDEAVTDGAQTLNAEQFQSSMKDLRALAAALGLTIQ